MIGGQLIFLIDRLIYSLWILHGDQSINDITYHRFRPFQDLQVVISPALPHRIAPTAAQLCVAGVLMSDYLLRASQAWPPRIDGSISDRGQYIGLLAIGRQPIGKAKGMTPFAPNASSLSSSMRAGLSVSTRIDRGPQLTAGTPIDEKVWLWCFQRLMLYAFRFPAWRLVAEDLPPGTTISAETADGQVRFSLETTEYEQERFTWDYLARVQLLILEEWARVNEWRTMDLGEIRIDGWLVAEIKIEALVGQQTLNVATA